MRWIADHVKAVKLTPTVTGYRWDSFPVREWNNAMVAVSEALRLISVALSLVP
jgi:hypothetical protein